MCNAQHGRQERRGQERSTNEGRWRTKVGARLNAARRPSCRPRPFLRSLRRLPTRNPRKPAACSPLPLLLESHRRQPGGQAGHSPQALRDRADTQSSFSHILCILVTAPQRPCASTRAAQYEATLAPLSLPAAGGHRASSPRSQNPREAEGGEDVRPRGACFRWVIRCWPPAHTRPPGPPFCPDCPSSGCRGGELTGGGAVRARRQRSEAPPRRAPLGPAAGMLLAVQRCPCSPLLIFHHKPHPMQSGGAAGTCPRSRARP